tara:strand:+ start:4080 stop:5534 length:1455 start_codon:yes stop_codon:yes gene_type:complete
MGVVSEEESIFEQMVSSGRAPIYGWLYDALGRQYRVLYRVEETKTNGQGPLLASNLPGTFKDTLGYPKAFQARSLQRAAERAKIQRIARQVDPLRLLMPTLDATIGSPVVWRSHGGDGTTDGVRYVLGGNGRTIAMLMANEGMYRKYERIGKKLWPRIWPSKQARDGYRHILVRQVFPAACRRRDMVRNASAAHCRLSFDAAVELAGSTQASQAAQETPLGKALSLVRSLGLDPTNIASQMPSFQWSGAIARDNVGGFMEDPRTLALRSWASRLMGQAVYDNRTSDPDGAAKLFQSLMIGFLPQSVILAGFGSEKEEQALMAALPVLAQVSILAANRDRNQAWNILPSLPDARTFLRQVRNLSFKKTLNEVKRMANQETLTLTTVGGQSVLVLSDRMTPQAVLLSLILKRGEQARDPSIPVERVMRSYLKAVLKSPNPKNMSLFGAPPPPKVALALGKALAEDMSGEGAPPIRVVTRRQRRGIA